MSWNKLFFLLLLPTLSFAGTHMQQGDAAGGGLSGTYPNPTVSTSAFSGGATNYIQNTLSPTTTTQAYSVMTGSVTGQFTFAGNTMPVTLAVGHDQTIYCTDGVCRFGDAPGFSMVDANAYDGPQISTFNPVGGFYGNNEVLAATGTAAAAAITQYRAFYVNLRSSGEEAGTDFVPLYVAPQTGSVWTNKISDGVDVASVTVLAGGNGLRVDGSGVTQPISGSIFLTTTSVSINGSSNTVISNQGTAGAQGWPVTSTNTLVQGFIASSTTNSGNPVKFGVVASTDIPTPTTHNKIMDAYGAKDGALIVNLDCPRDLITKSSITISTTTEVVILSSGAAGVYNDLIEIIAINTSATDSRVDFRSGGNGTTIDFALYVPSGDQRGKTMPHRWPQTTAASNWTAQVANAITDMRIYALYCKTR